MSTCELPLQQLDLVQIATPEEIAEAESFVVPEIQYKDKDD
jgi:hypothetical protein